MSLRNRLTALLLVAIGIPLLAVGVALGFVVPSWLRGAFDDSLETRARALAAGTRHVDDEIEVEFSDELMPEFGDDEEPYFFEIWLDDELLERSRSFHPSRELTLAPLLREREVLDEPRFRLVTLPDGRDGRQVQLDFVPETEEGEEDEEDDPLEEPFEEDDPLPSPEEARRAGTVAVGSVLIAGGVEELEAQVAVLRAGVAVLTLLLLGLLAGIVRLTLRVGLRPIDRTARQVASMDAESLERRIDGTEAPAELQPFIQQLNEFIDRLAVAFRRERQLTADMAHELRTPIAELRSLSEVGGRWPEDRAAVVRFFADANTVAQQMDRVVTHLLALARHDAGQQAAREVEVEMGELVATAWRPLAAEAGERGLDLELECEGDTRALSDPDMLALILSNLLSNAIRHGDPTEPIRVSVARVEDGICVAVANRTSELEEEDLAVMFDRFWRKDGARSCGSSAGLGLSLVRAFSHVLGLEVSASLEAGTYRISLVVPPAPPSVARAAV